MPPNHPPIQGWGRTCNAVIFQPAGIVGGLSLIMISALYYLQLFLANSPEYVFWLLSLLSPTALAMGIDKASTAPSVSKVVVLRKLCAVPALEHRVKQCWKKICLICEYLKHFSGKGLVHINALAFISTGLTKFTRGLDRIKESIKNIQLDDTDCSKSVTTRIAVLYVPSLDLTARGSFIYPEGIFLGYINIINFTLTTHIAELDVPKLDLTAQGSFYILRA